MALGRLNNPISYEHARWLKLTEKTLVLFSSDNGSTPKDFKGTQNVQLNLADDSGEIRAKFKTAKEDAKKMGHVTNGPWRDGKG